MSAAITVPRRPLAPVNSPRASWDKDGALQQQAEQQAELREPASRGAPPPPHRAPLLGWRERSWAPGALALGGHRGHGVNGWSLAADRPPFRWRENTLRSMCAAVAAGATFVELDAQVTADGAAVVWHDDYVVTGPAAAPVSRLVSQLTLAQFRALTAKELLRFQNAGHAAAAPGEPGLGPWAAAEDDALLSLADVFAGLPPAVGVNVEVKLAGGGEPAAPAEVARVVAAVAAAVAAGAAAAPARPLLLSSFDPDAVLALRAALPAVPAMFLSEGDAARAHADARRVGVAAALDFAAGAGLEGVVLAAAAVEADPGAPARAHARGLRVMTYGALNNDAAVVRRHAAAGVDGVIVDDVAGVVGALRGAARRRGLAPP